MNGVNIYGEYGTSETVNNSFNGVLSNSGLILTNGNLSLKIDPNPINDLSLSTNGLLGNGLKINGSNSMSGNLNMNNNDILVGNLTGAPNLSAVTIKQLGQLNISGSTSIYGIKMFNNTTNDAY